MVFRERMYTAQLLAVVVVVHVEPQAPELLMETLLVALAALMAEAVVVEHRGPLRQILHLEQVV